MFILYDLILQFFLWTIQNPLLIYTDFRNLCSTGKQTNAYIVPYSCSVRISLLLSFHSHFKSKEGLYKCK
jgi:hypothetical protein